VRNPDVGYAVPPTSRIGPRKYSPTPASTGISWRRVPCSASQNTGNSASTPTPDALPPPAWRSSAADSRKVSAGTTGGVRAATAIATTSRPSTTLIE
jgi:hypothetical protein